MLSLFRSFTTLTLSRRIRRYRVPCLVASSRAVRLASWVTRTRIVRDQRPDTLRSLWRVRTRNIRRVEGVLPPPVHRSPAPHRRPSDRRRAPPGRPSPGPRRLAPTELRQGSMTTTDNHSFHFVSQRKSPEPRGIHAEGPEPRPAGKRAKTWWESRAQDLVAAVVLDAGRPLLLGPAASMKTGDPLADRPLTPTSVTAEEGRFEGAETGRRRALGCHEPG